MTAFDFQHRTRVVYGDGAFSRLGELARELDFARTLVVSDPGIVAAGHAARAGALLEAAGVTSFGFHDFSSDPDTAMVETGRAVAADCHVDSIVALGGGSSLDCAKGINFVLTNGGTMRDYWGHGKAARPMLPSIGVPTTAGTGSEAQSHALISDETTHVKMACGDAKAMFRVAILDPLLTVSQPRQVTAMAGYDAVSHAVESYVTARHTMMSDTFAREAWRLLDGHFERVLADPTDIGARGAMLLGAHQAGMAIEQSMLGATHACANPLSARYGIPHGVAIAVMLPHVVRWNAEYVGDRYADLLRLSGQDPGHRPGVRLAARLEELARAGGLPTSLGDLNVPLHDLGGLSADAARQWTGTFNPRPFDEASALALYRHAAGVSA
jgi:alcohol dehydrogenase